MKTRITSKTPKFFRVIRNIGIVCAAAGTAVIASPTILPNEIANIGSYLILIGGVAAAIAQSVTESKNEK